MGKEIENHYRDLLHQHGDTYVSAQYSSKESQEARYKVLVDIADLNGSKVLDFGCGTGHFATYLKENGIHCDFTGVDIVDDFFPHAEKKHPKARFGKWEDFKDEEFDYIFISGVFNNKTKNNSSFFKDTIEELFSKAKKGMSFNLMSSYVDYEDKELWYIKPETVFSFIKTLTPFVTIRNDYIIKETHVPFEFAIYAFKKPQEAFK